MVSIMPGALCASLDVNGICNPNCVLELDLASDKYQKPFILSNIYAGCFKLFHSHLSARFTGN
jgi:hypothetical protein